MSAPLAAAAAAVPVVKPVRSFFPEFLAIAFFYPIKFGHPGSEIIGSAVDTCIGVLEYWGLGIVGLAEMSQSYINGMRPPLTKDIFRFYSPLFHYSFIPPFHMEETTPL